MTIDHNVVATERHINSEEDKAEQLYQAELGQLNPDPAVIETQDAAPDPLAGVDFAWVDAILEKYNELERILDCLGLASSAAVVDAQRRILQSHIMDEIQGLGKDPLLDMMQRLLDRAKEKKDDRGYLQVCPVNSDLNNLMWRSSRPLHHQIHQANMAGYHWPENLHLMLEQRDYWCADDVCWLIQRVTEYLNGQHDPKQPMTVSYTLFGRTS